MGCFNDNIKHQFLYVFCTATVQLQELKILSKLPLPIMRINDFSLSITLYDIP